MSNVSVAMQTLKPGLGTLDPASQKVLRWSIRVQEVSMFLRFVSPEFCYDSECRLGIFQAAYQLLESGNLAVHEEE
jgi:hypothetical protein